MTYHIMYWLNLLNIHNSKTFRQCLITAELQSKTYIYSDDTCKKMFLLVPQFKRLLSKVMGLSTHPKSRQNFTAHLVTTVDISWGLVTRFSEKRRQSTVTTCFMIAPLWVRDLLTASLNILYHISHYLKFTYNTC